MEAMNDHVLDPVQGLVQWLDTKWKNASFRFGLARPTEETEIHTYRVLDAAAPMVKCCRRSVIPANPMSNPVRTIEQIIEAWPDLNFTEEEASWQLIEIDESRMKSYCNDLHCPSYILMLRNGGNLHFRAHCVLEVTFRNCEYVEAVSLPPFIHAYVVMELLASSFGHILESNCRIFLNGNVLTEELVECQTGNFLQVDIFRVNSERVAADLRQMLCRYLWRVHLPLKTLADGQHLIQLFVPRGGTPFSGALITSQSSLENWSPALRHVARLAFPARDPDMQRFYRVHHSLEQVQPHSEVVFSFILGELNELDDDTCVIIVTVRTRESTTTGACMWPKSTSIWRLFDLCLTGRAWSVYHNNQKMNHRNVFVNNGDHFSCYEKLPSVQECAEPNNITESDQPGRPVQGKTSDGSTDAVRFTSVRPLWMPKSMPPLPKRPHVGSLTSQPLSTQRPTELGSVRNPAVTERQALLACSPFGNPIGSTRFPDGQTYSDSTRDPTIVSGQVDSCVAGDTPVIRQWSEQCSPVEPKRASPRPSVPSAGCPSSLVVNQQVQGVRTSTCAPSNTERQELLAGSPFGNPCSTLMPPGGQHNSVSLLDSDAVSDHVGLPETMSS